MNKNDSVTGAMMSSGGAPLLVATASGAISSLAQNAHADVPPSDVDDVIVQKVTFKNRILIDLAADFYMPAKVDRSRKYKAIVVGPPFGSVKEQTSGLHAQKLAQLGYVAIAFDPSFRGESGGMPRQIDVPEIRVEDFSAAVDYLANHPLVDANGIGVLGICASGSYSLSATQIDPRIKALATVSMYDIGRARREGIGHTMSYERRMQVLDEIGQQRTIEFRGAERRDISSIPTKLTGQETPILREFYDYYRTPRGNHPRATNTYSFTSQAPLMNFFAFAQIETISPRPLLFIVGEHAESAYFTEDAFARAAMPKELFVVPGASHVDLYDVPEFTSVSIRKIDTFFREHL